MASTPMRVPAIIRPRPRGQHLARQEQGNEPDARLARAPAPPSSRSTTQIAVRHSVPAARSASTASAAAPPVVTTSSTRQTSSPGSVDALEEVRRSVVLARLADDQERKPGRERGRGGERDRTELGAGEAATASGSSRPTVLGDQRAERAEDVGPRLEAVLVEVVAASAAPSGGRSPPRGRRARGSARASSRVVNARGSRRAAAPSTLARERQQAVGLERALLERDHRAVREVEIDVLARPRATPPEQRAPAIRGCGDERRRRALPLAIVLLRFLGRRLRRRLRRLARRLRRELLARDVAQAGLQVVEHEPDGRLGRRSPRRRSIVVRARRRRTRPGVAAWSWTSRSRLSPPPIVSLGRARAGLARRARAHLRRRAASVPALATTSPRRRRAPRSRSGSRSRSRSASAWAASIAGTLAHFSRQARGRPAATQLGGTRGRARWLLPDLPGVAELARPSPVSPSGTKTGSYPKPPLPRGLRARSSPRACPVADSSPPSGASSTSSHTYRAAPARALDGRELLRAAARGSRRRSRPRRRTGPSGSPGAPPSPSTSSPESSPSTHASGGSPRAAPARLRRGRSPRTSRPSPRGIPRGVERLDLPVRAAARAALAASRGFAETSATFTPSRDRRRRCGLDDPRDPGRGKVEQLVEAGPRERGRLGRRLHLDQAPVARHDDVHVDLGGRVLRVVEVEQRTRPSTIPTETAATCRWARAARARRAASASATQTPEIAAVRVPPSASSTSQSSQTVRSPSASMLVGGAERAPDQPLDLDRPPLLLARRSPRAACGSPVEPGQHAVLGRDPALAAARQPAGDALLDRRGAQHARPPERDERRAVRLLEEAGTISSARSLVAPPAARASRPSATAHAAARSSSAQRRPARPRRRKLEEALAERPELLRGRRS